jgi:hypothetical protein
MIVFGVVVLTHGALKVIGQTVRDIPRHRLAAPDADLWGAAGILAGLLFRLGTYPKGAERRCLNDALVYLQARKLGWPVVTGNIKDFDFLNQLVPDGRRNWPGRSCRLDTHRH